MRRRGSGRVSRVGLTTAGETTYSRWETLRRTDGAMDPTEHPEQSEHPQAGEFPGFTDTTYHEFTREGIVETEGPVISESFVCLYLNGAELATLMASPFDAVELVIGFLRSEGIIESPDDPDEIVPAPNRRCVDVWLKNRNVQAPGRRIVTSGCGGGVTFEDVRNRREPITTDMRIEADALIALMAEFTRPVEPRGKTRGLHAAALSDGRRLLLKREDIGRHNAIDRLWGAAMLEHVETAGQFLMSTGRISSEMLMKAARMHAPIVASRTTPTSLTVRLAREWNITLVGYVRSHLLRVYSHPERILGSISE